MSVTARVLSFALATSRVVGLAPPCFEISPELLGKAPRQIVFLAPSAIARELVEKFLALRVLGCLCVVLRLLLGDAFHPLGLIFGRRRRRCDHVGEHVENLGQGSDHAIKQATAAIDALLGNAGHLAKGALIAPHVALELAAGVPRRAASHSRFGRLGPALQLGVDHLLLERRCRLALDFQGGAGLDDAGRGASLGQASLNPVLEATCAEPEHVATAG